MANFTTDKLSKLAATRGARAAYVCNARRAAADNVYLVERLAKEVLLLVRDEARDFADTFGEPLPPHLERSLEAEINLWEQLAVGLKALGRAQVSEHALEEYARRVRGYLGCHEDLLRLQQEMVRSCLVRHYDELREQILAGAARYDITNI